MRSLSFIIPTYNEELHIERCIRSVFAFAECIYVIDSYSSDRTLDIARAYNCRILQRKFDDHSSQLNWALSRINCTSDWLFRLDADEILDDKSFSHWQAKAVDLSDSFSGVAVERDIVFQGHLVKFGGIAKKSTIRIFRPGKARYNGRVMDEKLILEGKVYKSRIRIIDDNKNSIRWWWRKHLGYASKEVSAVRSEGSNRCRLGKNYYYYFFPSKIRPFLYFFLRYFALLGFLDGIRRPNYHCLQGLRYRRVIEKKLGLDV